jgi:hypothetical protein
VVTPAMVATIPGKGSEYVTNMVDSKKQPFDGSKTYRLRVPANPPAARFWSATISASIIFSRLLHCVKQDFQKSTIY